MGLNKQQKKSRLKIDCHTWQEVYQNVWSLSLPVIVVVVVVVVLANRMEKHHLPFATPQWQQQHQQQQSRQQSTQNSQ